MSEKFIRKFTEEERVSYVKEALEAGSNILIAKKYGIHPNLLSKWINNYRRYQQTLEPKESTQKQVIPNYKKEYKRMQKDLEEKELEIKILRDLLKKKNLL